MGYKDQKASWEARKKIICELVNDSIYVPMKEKELAAFMQVAKEDREEFRSILRELLEERKLSLTSGAKYVKGNGPALIGTFISHPKGFGFVEIESAGDGAFQEDLYIPEGKAGGAFHRDTVEVALLPESEGRRQEAQAESSVISSLAWST